MNPDEMTVLGAIKLRPAMYLMKPSLTALYVFLNGYEFGRNQEGIAHTGVVPTGFRDWVSYRLQVPSMAMGWLHLILERFPDEAEALDCFFRLLDEFQQRKGTVVGITKTRRRTYYLVNIQSREPDADSRPLTKKFKEWAENNELSNGMKYVRNAYRHPAESLKLVVYANDPGFFLISTDKPDDCGHFYESLDCAKRRLGPRYLTMFEVLNQEIFDRLLRENLAYRKRVAECRAEARRKNHGLNVETHPLASGTAHLAASPA